MSCLVYDISEKRNTLQSSKISIKLLGMSTGTGRGGRRDDNIKIYVERKDMIWTELN